MMTAVVFKDPELQARFERDGYVVFDLLSGQDAATIAEKFYELHHEIPGGFYSTASNPNDEFKKELSDHAEQVLAPKMATVFQNYKKLGITFLCKAPGESGKVPVHRDWMVVDETKYFSGTIWIPTVDTSEENGALRVLPGSHKFFNEFRSSSIPAAYKGYEPELWDQMITVPMKAGQAFLLNHAVIHASSPNITDKERLILVCGITPAPAKLMYFHGTDRGTVEKFDMPDDMFMRHFDIGGRPLVGVKVDEFKYSVKPENRLKIQNLVTTAKSGRAAKPFFKNEEMQVSFAKNGYLKVPILNGAEVNDLMNLFGEPQAEVCDPEIAEKIRNQINSKISFSSDTIRAFDARLDTRRKKSNELGPLQQDWTYTDNENEYCSVTCWIPLADITIGNGAIGFVPGSHLFVGNIRSSPYPRSTYKFKGNNLDVIPYLQTVELKAGEAFIFDHRLFRTELPNIGSNYVPVITIKLVHPDAGLCHYYLDPDSKRVGMLKYEVDEQFFEKYDNQTLSLLYENGKKIVEYKQLETVAVKYPEFTVAELLGLIMDKGGELNKPLNDFLITIPEYSKYFSEKEKSIVSADNDAQTPDSEEPAPVDEEAKKDDLNFGHKYTLQNIIREIKKRIIG